MEVESKEERGRGEEGDRRMIGKIHCSRGAVHPLPLD